MSSHEGTYTVEGAFDPDEKPATAGPAVSRSYRVANGTQVNVGGTVHSDGEVFQTDPALVQKWLEAGLVEEIDPAVDKPDKRYRRPR